MKILKKIGWLLLFVFIIAQFFGPEKNEGELTSLVPFINETNPPENVQKILTESCFDCHSNVTKYPWYNRITPVNYWMNDHIKVGKKKLNFSKSDTVFRIFNSLHCLIIFSSNSMNLPMRFPI